MGEISVGVSPSQPISVSASDGCSVGASIGTQGTVAVSVEPGATIEVPFSPNVPVSANVASPESALVDVSIAAGPPGPPGPPGASALIELSDVQVDLLSPGDVLRYDNSRWRNYPETNLVDGGNF